VLHRQLRRSTMPEIKEGDGVFEGSIDGRTVPRGFCGDGGGLDGNGDCMAANGGNARGSQGDGHEQRESLSRLNILIAATAAIVGLIYGCDLGSIAYTLLFLVPAFDLSTFMTSVVTLGQLLGRSSPDASPRRSVVNARWL
jgi:hypothetical protein